MARLDKVITNIVDIFLEYASDEGRKRQLNKEEFRKMLESEIQSPELKVRHSKRSCMICTSVHRKQIFLPPRNFSGVFLCNYLTVRL